jgi:hypothetical protein
MMTEPTIDDMLAWLDGANTPTDFYERSPRLREAIRAILEGHRPPPPSLAEARRAFLIEERHEVGLQAIRAFVERVEKRLPDYNTGKGADSWLKAYRVAVMDELAEMEKT